MKNAINDVITKDNPSDTSICYAYPLDDIDWFILQAWQSIVPTTVWMNEDCSGWPSDKLDALHKHLQTLVTQVLPDNWLHDYSTPVCQACYLRCHVDEQRTLDRFTLFNAHYTESPLCLIHPAILPAYAYYGLAQFMQQDHPLLAIHCHPDLEKNHAKINGLDMLRSVAAHYTDLLLEVQPQGAYHLGGWSLGGLLAIEMASALQKKGKRVASLSLIDPFFAVHDELDLIKTFFNKFGDNNQAHTVTQYFSSLKQTQSLRKIKKWLRIERPMSSSFDFSHCDIPTLIIQANDVLIDHQQNIKKFFSNHKLINSDFDHCSMMENACARMMAPLIDQHLKENI